jgi:hypothetical protein
MTARKGAKFGPSPPSAILQSHWCQRFGVTGIVSMPSPGLQTHSWNGPCACDFTHMCGVESVDKANPEIEKKAARV